MTGTDSPSIPEDTYYELMGATLEALSKHGYADLRVRDIDAEFSKSRQLIHHYYGGKDELITEMLSFILDHSERELAQIDGDDPTTQLSNTIDHVLFGGEHDPQWEFSTALYEILSQAHHNPEHQALFDRLTREFVDQLDEVIREGIGRGVFEDVETAPLARTIDTIVTGAHVKKIFIGYDDAPANARVAIEWLVRAELGVSMDAPSSSMDASSSE